VQRKLYMVRYGGLMGKEVDKLEILEEGTVKMIEVNNLIEQT